MSCSPGLPGKVGFVIWNLGDLEKCLNSLTIYIASFQVIIMNGVMNQGYSERDAALVQVGNLLVLSGQLAGEYR
jgi:hypothetical protein